MVRGNCKRDISFAKSYVVSGINRIEQIYVSHFPAQHVLGKVISGWGTLRSLLPVF